jgi:tRNA(adenine34) deaminase
MEGRPKYSADGWARQCRRIAPSTPSLDSARADGLGNSMSFPSSLPMARALAAAAAAGARGEVPVGAVIVDPTGAIIAEAGNRTRELCDPTAHAELLAIRAACAVLGSERLSGCDLHVTLEPCPMCATAISFARIARVYYAAPDPKGGGVDHGPRVYAHPTCHHRPEVYGGIGESEAAALLRSFFADRRC